jgi:hypothetical protein
VKHVGNFAVLGALFGVLAIAAAACLAFQFFWQGAPSRQLFKR